MLKGFHLYDSDAHTITSPRMWQDLPPEYHARRPRPVEIGDAEGLGGFDRSWLIEGRLVPHPFGPGAQAGNTPAGNLVPFPGTSHAIHLTPGSDDVSSPDARIKDLDRLGVDTSVMFPSTIYARLTTDPTTKQTLSTRAQEWLKLAYSDRDDEFERLLGEFNTQQMGAQTRASGAHAPMQRQPMQQQQTKAQEDGEG